MRSRSVTWSIALLTLLLLGACPPGAAARWIASSGTGTPVCEAPNFQFARAAVADGAGGAFIAFEDQRSSPNLFVFVQHLNTQGDPLWAPNGVQANTAASSGAERVCLMSDGSGGVFVANSYSNAATGYDIVAQRFDRNGSPLWGAAGVTVVNAVNIQDSPVISADGSGGVILGWEDSRTTAITNVDIYAQRLNGAGVPQWAANGVVVCNAAGQQSSTVIVSDGAGGAILGWRDSRNNATTSLDLYAQRLNAAGVPQWAANGSAITTAAGSQSGFDMVSDDLHGALIVFDDGRNSATTGFDLYVQHLDGSGQRLFFDLALTTQTGSQLAPVACADGQGGMFVSWTDSRTANQQIFAAHLNQFLTNTWTTDGVAVTSAALVQSRNAIQMIADGFGGCDLYWTDSRFGSVSPFGQRLGATGAAQWTADGVLMAGTSSGTFPGPACSDGRGGLISSFAQNRNSNTTDVFASRLDRYGFLGQTEPVITHVSDVKNDQGGKLKLTFDASYLEFDGFGQVSSYDIFRSVPAALAAQRVASGARMTRDAAAVGADRAHTLLLATVNAQDYAFEFIAAITALDVPSYSFIVPTLGDSVANSNPPTIVMVQARGGSRYWSSLPDSGYSVDNLRPAAPAPFTGQFAAAQTKLHWNRNTEADLAGYRVYRGLTPGFAIGAGTLVAAVPDTGYTDPSAQPYFYKLTAVDVHGNESPVATLTPQGVLGVDDAGLRGLALARPAPCPAVRATRMAFTLPRAGHVTLALFDAAGRRVRHVAAGDMEAGEHSSTVTLADDAGHALAAGLYFVRLQAAGTTLTQRLTILHD